MDAAENGRVHVLHGCAVRRTGENPSDMLSETANVRAAIREVVFMVREKKPSSVSA